MYPIDLLKVSCPYPCPAAPRAEKCLTQTRMQVVNAAPATVYSGISNAVITISRVEGFRSLWKGLSSVVVGAGLSFRSFTQIIPHRH